MSDTIIMYENGKAIGGEGHPTDADEITFNNEDTDLVSEEVESAIKEVNAKFDKGYIEVVGNGVKTRSQLMDELYALIDSTKLTPFSVLVFGDLYCRRTFNYLGYAFTYDQATDYGMFITQYWIRQSNSTCVSAEASYGSTPTKNDASSSVVANGTKIRLYY